MIIDLWLYIERITPYVEQVEEVLANGQQRQEQRKDGLVSRYSSDTYKLIGRQRSGITLLSRAIRQG